MNSPELDELINDLKNNNEEDLQSTERIQSLFSAFEKFNQKNGTKFRFETTKPDETDKISQIRCIYSRLLNTCWTFMSNIENFITKESLFRLNVSLASQILDSIRLISRDKSWIKVFESEEILAKVQQMANLSLTQLSNFLAEMEAGALIVNKDANDLISGLNVYALKSMSNLIYNSG